MRSKRFSISRQSSESKHYLLTFLSSNSTDSYLKTKKRLDLKQKKKNPLNVEKSEETKDVFKPQKNKLKKPPIITKQNTIFETGIDEHLPKLLFKPTKLD